MTGDSASRYRQGHKARFAHGGQNAGYRCDLFVLNLNGQARKIRLSSPKSSRCHFRIGMPGSLYRFAVVIVGRSGQRPKIFRQRLFVRAAQWIVVLYGSTRVAHLLGAERPWTCPVPVESRPMFMLGLRCLHDSSNLRASCRGSTTDGLQERTAIALRHDS